MRVTDILASAKSTLFTLELLPPLKGGDFHAVSASIDQLMPYHPAYINITNHREEVVRHSDDKGLYHSVKVRHRAGTASVAAAIHYKYGVEVVPHLICGGSTAQEIENTLVDLCFLGIDNVLVLRGDAGKDEPQFSPCDGGYLYAIDLLKQVKDLNNSKLLDPKMSASMKANFCCGVAGYPEVHGEALNRAQDLLHLKAKVDAGADYIVTQMFFDPEIFIRFVADCRAIGISVPIIPGIKPLASKKQLDLLPDLFHIDIPELLRKEVQAAKTDVAVRQIGVEWAIEQCKRLKADGVPALHFYTMSKADNVEAVVKAVF